MVSAVCIRKDFQNSIAMKKLRSLRMGEGVPLKKDRKRSERRALIVSIIANEKLLIAYHCNNFSNFIVCWYRLALIFFFFTMLVYNTGNK